MGLKIISTLIKAVRKAPYVAPKIKIGTLDSLGIEMKQLGKDVFQFEKNSRLITLDATKQSSFGMTKAFKEKLDLYNATKLLKSEGFNTGTTVLNNWRPEFGLKTNGVYKNAIEELYNNGAIERYIQKRFPSIESPYDIEKIKSVLTNYLEKNLDIYTYPRISKCLKDFHPEIVQKLKDGAVIYMPNKEKSYNLITQMYKEINPDAKVIEGYKNLKMFLENKKGVNIIVLDDCLVSGKSSQGLYKNIFKDMEGASEKVKSLDLYVLSAFKDGLNKVPKGINVHYSDLKYPLTQSDYFRKELLPLEKSILLATLGSSDLKYNAYCATMFPYMSPNNNSLFSAHMIKELFSGPECAIKGIFGPPMIDDVAKLNSLNKALSQISAVA